MRALVIEDDEQIADVNKRVLEGEGFAVELAGTLGEGQRLASGDDYDIIVTDLMLPDGHGLAIVERVRGRGKGTPILVLTGVDAVESTVAALDLGADDYLRRISGWQTGSGYKSDADRIPHKTGDVVHA